jgi:ABC-type Na+ transport system ATPase subunit NatA
MASQDDKKYLEILKKLTADAKLNSAFDLFDLAKERIASQIKKESPLMSQLQLKQKINERLFTK